MERRRGSTFHMGRKALSTSGGLRIAVGAFALISCFLIGRLSGGTGLGAANLTIEDGDGISTRAGFSGQEMAKEDCIAFFIQVSPGNFARLDRLLSALWDERNVYIIHFDLKISQLDLASLRKNSAKLAQRNVIVMQSETLSWGGISLVLNLIEAMRILIDRNIRFTHFINTSPSEFPLVTPQVMRDILSEHRNESFGHFQALEAFQADGDNAERFLKKMHFDGALFGKKAEISKGDEFPTLKEMMDEHFLVKGEAWFILSYEAAKYVVSSTETKKWLFRVGHARAPDEWVVQNVVAHSEELAQRTFNEHLRFILWRHPVSGNLFARKFDQTEGSIKIENKIKGELWTDPQHIVRVKTRISRSCFVSTDTCRKVIPSAIAAQT